MSKSSIQKLKEWKREYEIIQREAYCLVPRLQQAILKTNCNLYRRFGYPLLNHIRSVTKLKVFISVTHAGVCKPTLIVREYTELPLINYSALHHPKLHRRHITECSLCSF